MFQILILAVLYALFIKKPDTEDEEQTPAEMQNLNSDEKWLHQHNVGSDEHKRLLQKYRRAPMPLDKDYVKAAREKRYDFTTFWKRLAEYSVV